MQLSFNAASSFNTNTISHLSLPLRFFGKFYFFFSSRQFSNDSLLEGEKIILVFSALFFSPFFFFPSPHKGEISQ